MKPTIIFVLCLAVIAAESKHASVLDKKRSCGLNQKLIIYKPLDAKLKELLKEIDRAIIGQTKDILTDGIQLSSPQNVREGLEKEVPSAEGVLEAAADLLVRRAVLLGQQYQQENPSQEGILDEGYLPRFSEAEEYLTARYNNSQKYNGPSHEGILGSFGGIAIRGLGDLIGGDFGNILKGAGDFVGNLFYVVPEYPISREGIIPAQPHQQGVLSDVGNLLQRGAGRLARNVLRGVFSVAHQVFENIFLSRGHFHSYRSLEAVGDEEILKARHYIHHAAHPEAKPCLNAAEKNFTRLFRAYVNSSRGCVKSGHETASDVVGLLQDAVLDSVRRVELVHREAGFCFDKVDEQNRQQCLDHDVPELIDQHREKLRHYAADLADYVRDFTQINSEFDVCLTRHLGTVRRQIYSIVNDFHTCLPLYPGENASNSSHILQLKSFKKKQALRGGAFGLNLNIKW